MGFRRIQTVAVPVLVLLFMYMVVFNNAMVARADGDGGSETIAFVLTDSWGDGWNGSEILIKDAETGETVQTLTLSAGAELKGTINLVVGKKYDFYWTPGAYHDETGFTFTDHFNTVIYSASKLGTGGKIFDYTAKDKVNSDMSGVYSEGINWNWYENENKLIFSGEGTIPGGDLYGYTLENYVPFVYLKDDKENVTVEIQSGITGIDNFAFSNHDYIGNVIIADTVTSMGKSSFRDCSNLESVTISNNIKSIGEKVFADCPKLTVISGGNSIESVADSAFSVKTEDLPDGKLVKTHVVTTSEKLKDNNWYNYNRVLVITYTLMDYTGENLIAKINAPGDNYTVFSNLKNLMKDEGISEADIPKGINLYSWYTKKNGTKEDLIKNTFGVTEDIVVYGMPTQTKDGKLYIDVSEGKKLIIDSRTEYQGKGMEAITAMLLMDGMLLTAEALYADEMGIDLSDDDEGMDGFSEWRYNKKIYISPIPAAKMSPNEKHFVDMFYRGVDICTHATLEPNEDSLFSFIFEKKTTADGKNYNLMTFESVDKNGIETKNVCEFGAFLLSVFDGDGIPVPVEEDEKGFRYGYKTLTIEVKYGQTPKPEPSGETPKPAEETKKPEPKPTEAPKAEEDITKIFSYAENVPVETKEKVIKTTNTDKKDVEGSVHKYLMLKISPKKTSIKLSWNKINGASGYIIYGAKCGKNMEPLVTISNPGTNSYTFKKLKKGTYYKYLVVSYKTTSTGDKVISTSKSVHATTDEGKKGNPTSLKLKKSKLTVKKGKKKAIKASFTKKKPVAIHIAKFRYESDNPKIATVDKNGKVKGVSKGKTKIYVYTQNGLCKTVSITVK